MNADLEKLFEMIYTSASITNNLKDLQGRITGTQPGIVLDRNDPETKARIKVTTANLGGVSETNWLERIQPFPFLSTPVPNVGDTVLIGYLDGDPHKGVYWGVFQNRLNPADDKDSLVLVIGDVTLAIRPDSVRLTLGEALLTILPEMIELRVSDSLYRLEPEKITEICRGKSVKVTRKPTPIECPTNYQTHDIVEWGNICKFTINGQEVG